MRFSGLCWTVFFGRRVTEAGRLASMSVRSECCIAVGAVAVSGCCIPDSVRFVQHSGLPLSFLPEVLFSLCDLIVSPFLVVQSITVSKDEGQECVRASSRFVALLYRSLQTGRTINDSQLTILIRIGILQRGRVSGLRSRRSIRSFARCANTRGRSASLTRRVRNSRGVNSFENRKMRKQFNFKKWDC